MAIPEGVVEAQAADVYAILQRVTTAGVRLTLDGGGVDAIIPEGDAQAAAAVAELRPHRGAVREVLLERALLGERIVGAIDRGMRAPPSGWMAEVNACWLDIDLRGLEVLAMRFEAWARGCAHGTS